MNFLKFIKHIFLFLLTFLIGTQTTYAKTELVLPQNQVSFSIEQSQSFNSLEKEVPPNIGFLKEKYRFVVSEGVTAQNQHKFSEIVSGDLANTVGKTKIIRKLDALGELTNARRLINSLDDVADAPFLSRLDNLTNTQLQKLDEFYGSLKHPQGYAGQLDYTVTKTIGDVPVSITYKNGVPDLRGHSPILNFTDGTSAGKFKFESSNLTGKKTDFTQANTALARKFGVEKSGGNWPWNNGYMSNGNFRIAQTNSGGMSQQFELLENGNWVKYTWHHFEDGRTVFPVKTSIHSVPTGFNHSGGKSIISKGLQDLFEFIGF